MGAGTAAAGFALALQAAVANSVAKRTKARRVENGILIPLFGANLWPDRFELRAAQKFQRL
jgi:hypothetical protein